MLLRASLCVEKWWGHKSLDEKVLSCKQSSTDAILGNMVGKPYEVKVDIYFGGKNA